MMQTFSTGNISPVKNYALISPAWNYRWSVVLVFVILGLCCPCPVFSTPVAEVSDCSYIGQGEIFQDIAITVDDPFQGTITRTFDYYVPQPSIRHSRQISRLLLLFFTDEPSPRNISWEPQTMNMAPIRGAA